MKNLSLFLALVLLLQSCNVYNGPASVETAVDSEKKVLLVSPKLKKLYFQRLERRDDQLIGVTKSGSSTAKKLAGMPAEIDGKLVKFDLSGVSIEKVKLRNNASSTVMTVLSVAATLAAAYVLYFILSFDSGDWSFGEGLEGKANF